MLAAQIYCPIADPDHADLAYEWLFNRDRENESSPAGQAGIMTPFQDALSDELMREYIEYFNSQELRDPESGEKLSINKDGRSGSGYDYLMKCLEESAAKYFKKLDRGENHEFGTPERDFMRFSEYIGPAVSKLKERFPEEAEKYYNSWKEVEGDRELALRKYLINPMNYIGTDEKSDTAQHCRIRVGAKDADTSFTISMALALKLAESGVDTDYALVWDLPHCEADYPGEVCDWIESFTSE